MELDELVNGIFHASYDTQLELCSTLVRFQEHYESPEFKGKVFTLKEFKKWYIANSPEGKRTGTFTYYTDWAGFNLPDYAFTPFKKGLFDPLSRKEKSLLVKLPNLDKFYFIGTFKGNHADTEYSLRHEVAHGLFYLNPAYKEEALKITSEIEPADRDKIHSNLIYAGYCEDVFEDELQAYTLTYDQSFVSELNLGASVASASEKLQKLFTGFAPWKLIKE